MNRIPTRTGTTNLTDAELLLFDFLFQHHVRRQALERDAYQIHMNCAYSHGLNSDELDATIHSLVDRKLVLERASTDSTEPSYTLTSTGGELWERERRADWGLYVDSRQNFGGTSQAALALDEKIARQYLGGQFAFGGVVVTGAIRTKTIHRCKLLPWRVFSNVCVARVPIRRQTDHVRMDFETYDESRTWWQTVHELHTLNQRIR